MQRQILTAVLLIVLPSMALAHGPTRQKVTKEVHVSAPAAEVWKLIADFCSIENWHPAIVVCNGQGGNEPGATRTLIIGEADGPQIGEELQKYDPPPELNDAAAVAAVTGVYDAGLAHIKELAEQ